MPTVRLDAYSKAFPAISNRIKASVALTSSPLAIVASIIDTTAGHPQRVWTFAALQRNNYDFSLDEIDASGNPINNLAYFTVTPGQLNGQIIRQEEQIQVGFTPGFNVGNNTFIFNGAETSAGSGVFKEDYRGWDIVPSELNGRGILIEGVDYSWNKTSGTFLLLIPNDLFQENAYYNIHFEPQLNPSGFGVNNSNDFQIILVQNSVSLTDSDFGKKIIVEPLSTYVEITLPLLSSIPQGRKCMIEVFSSSMCCVKLLTLGSDQIKYFAGDIFLLPNESLSIYKFIRSSGNEEYRLDSVDANIKSVGLLASDDDTQLPYLNRQMLDGSDGDTLTNARLYNYILNLPINQVCNYDDWTSGNNKYLYSLANSSNPSNLGKFKFPDRRNLYERNNYNGKAGDYQDMGIQAHKHYGYGEAFGNFPLGVLGPRNKQGNAGGNDGDNYYYGTTETGGTETRPITYLINKYVLL